MAITERRSIKLNKLPLIAILLLSNVILHSCTPASPRAMASEYCKCINKAFENDVPDAEQMNKCTALAQKHKEKLADDIEGLKIYADDIVNCGLYGKTSIDK